MKTEIVTVPETTIEQFAEKHGLVMQVRERGKNAAWRYYAMFKDVEITDGHFLISAFGDGHTPEEAIANYWPQLSEKHIVVNAYSRDRREITCPRFVLK